MKLSLTTTALGLLSVATTTTQPHPPPPSLLPPNPHPPSPQPNISQDNTNFICNLPSPTQVVATEKTSLLLQCSTVDGLPWLAELTKPALTPESPYGSTPWSMLVLRGDFHGQYALTQSLFEGDPNYYLSGTVWDCDMNRPLPGLSKEDEFFLASTVIPAIFGGKGKQEVKPELVVPLIVDGEEVDGVYGGDVEGCG